MFIKVKGFRNEFQKLVSKSIDFCRVTCYTESMIKRDKLTPGNIKMIGVPLSLHERLRTEAKAEHVAMFEVIEDALLARDKLASITRALTSADQPFAVAVEALEY